MRYISRLRYYRELELLRSVIIRNALKFPLENLGCYMFGYFANEYTRAVCLCQLFLRKFINVTEIFESYLFFVLYVNKVINVIIYLSRSVTFMLQLNSILLQCRKPRTE